MPQAARYGVAGDQDQYEVISDPRQFGALKHEWDELWNKSTAAYYSQSFDWCHTGWETVAQPRNGRLHTLLARNQGRLVLAWAFSIHRQSGCETALPLGSQTTEYSSPLVEDGPRTLERTAACWRKLRNTAGCDVIALPSVLAGSDLDRVISSTWTALVKGRGPSHYLTWQDYENWQSYYGQLGKSQRKDMARQIRRLEERGRLVFEPVVPIARRDEALDWILTTKIEWLRRNSQYNEWLRTPEYRGFFKALVAATDDDCHGLTISVLRLDDQIIAAELSVIDKVRVELLIPAFDSAYSYYSPGKILMLNSLKWAHERGLTFDLRIGDESYKTYWCNRKTTATGYHVINSAKGLLVVTAAESRVRARRLSLLIPPRWRRRIRAIVGRSRPSTTDTSSVGT